MLRRQRFPLGAVLVDVRAWLWCGTPVLRRPDALEAEPRTDGGPALAPRRGLGGVGDIEGALRRACGVQGGVDTELGDYVLGAVVGEDRIGFGSARERAWGAGTGNGGVEGQVDGQGLRKAVGVVVWDVADLEDMVVSGEIEWG